MWNLYWYYGIICKNTTDLIQIIGKLPGNGYENGIEDKSMDGILVDENTSHFLVLSSKWQN